jgi:hypothetical protein
MNTFDIANVGGVWISHLINNPKTTKNVINYYAIDKIKSVSGIYEPGIAAINPLTDNPKMPYDFVDKAEVIIAFINEDSNPPLKFDIQAVNNKTWKDNGGGLKVGLQEALDEIKGWKTT